MVPSKVCGSPVGPGGGGKHQRHPSSWEAVKRLGSEGMPVGLASDCLKPGSV